MPDIVSMDQFRRSTLHESPAQKASISKKTKNQPHQPVFFEEGGSAENISPPLPALPEGTNTAGASETTSIGSLVDDPTLPRAARDFRQRFATALQALVTEAMAELENVISPKNVKIKINVSAVLKRSHSSPLTAYSPLHRDVLLPLVESESLKVKKAQANQCNGKKKPTVASLQTELREAKEIYEKALSRLASQKMTDFIADRG